MNEKLKGLFYPFLKMVDTLHRELLKGRTVFQDVQRLNLGLWLIERRVKADGENVKIQGIRSSYKNHDRMLVW